PEGLEVIVLPELRRELSPPADWRAYRALLRLFRERHFSVVHTHASKAGILGRIAARRAGVPFVVHTVHGQAFHAYQSALVNRLYIAAERWAARHCDRIYAVAQAMIEQCVEAGVAPREKYQVVYSGMDLDCYLNAQRDVTLRAELGIPTEALVVGKIARLFELKGHEDLLAAAPKVLAAVPNTYFLLVGDGILREALVAQAEALGIRDRVIFAGLVPPRDICRYTAQMDVLVHLSLREGLPRAVVQGLATGIPAVAYPLDGTPEVVLDGETGRLCPVRQIDAIAAALTELLLDPDKRRALGQRGRAEVRKRFAWQQMADILEDEYKRGVAARLSARN
ncbi:MAG: glycosyltransferase family 4 protein, partial [Lentisphaerae bacterium]|nr:glycosyltransferase family 4 protein [Lentisphaerota bacterium]